MKKRFVCALLCGALCLTPALAAADEKFPAVKEYPGYADVAAGSWYEDAARTCYEVGLMNGTNLGFEPGKVLTVGECAAVAARIRETLTGEAIVASTPLPGESKAWYQDYVYYMQEADSTLTPMLAHPEEPISRMQYLLLLNAALPEDGDMLAPINSVEALPDVENETVLAFYNAGILTGTDKYGTFAGDRQLTRAECAAMVARLVRSGLRLPFTPVSYAPFTAAYLTPSTVMFDTGLRAEEFLITVNNAISAWEAALGEEFNWHYVWTDGKSVLDHVKEDSLSALGVTAKQGTQAYQDFDVQVYYARYISITGETLAPDQGAAVEA